jgi:hypothetical protein
MNMMNKVFMDELDKCVIVFINMTEEHEKHLRIVLEKLSNNRCMPKSASVSSGWRNLLFSVTCCQLKG